MSYFQQKEFDEPGLSGSGAKMSNSFLVHVNELRKRCGFPFVVTSGYRSPEYNKQVSDTGEAGPHTTGRAVDIACNAVQAYIIIREAMAMGVFTGIGISQKGNKRFVHLDDLTQKEGFPRPVLWTY